MSHQQVVVNVPSWQRRVLLLLGVLWICAASSARAQDLTEFEIPKAEAGPVDIAAGPDGNVWFSEWGFKIGRITPKGVITEFPLPIVEGFPVVPWKLTAGRDGNLWFTTGGWLLAEGETTPRIARITTAGVVTTFPVPARPQGIVTGPDGALWFGEGGVSKIGRITTEGEVTEFPTHLDGSVGAIAAGPDGALWFTQIENDRIGRMTMSGDASEITHSAPAASSASRPIVAGSDGNLWLLETSRHLVRRVTTAGEITDIKISESNGCIRGLAFGPDNALWFTEGGEGGAAPGKIGRVASTGAITHLNAPAGAFGFCGNDARMVAGPDGAIWFIEDRARKIGRIGIERRAPRPDTKENGGGGS